MSEIQRARCAAMYRPLFPDIVAIVRSCLEQHDLLPALNAPEQPR